MAKLQIMDTTIRDGQQSLWATRMSVSDILPILPKMDRVGYWAIEAWGGATFDACLRFLNENPWDRLRSIKAKTPNTRLSMLSRGQNLVGYKHYSEEIVHRFIHAAHKNGIDIFRVFDALNDIENIRDNACAIKECGAHFEGAISYTTSPVHTLDSFLEYAAQLKELGADSIAIKDMAGLLTPYKTEELVKALNNEIGLPVHMHCHYVGGMALTNLIKATEAGATIVDTASTPLAFGNSHPAVETVVSALQDSPYETNLDLDLLFEISQYWEDVRKRCRYKRGASSLDSLKIHYHQIPDAMIAYTISQLEVQNSVTRLDEVIEEISRVRAQVGYPPLITPISEIIATQAVFNVLTGKPWSVVSKEMRDYLCGYYGKAPAAIDSNLISEVLSEEDLADAASGNTLQDSKTFAQLEEELGDLATCEEDVLMYALFPNEARTFLSKHHKNEHVDFLLETESSHTKEDEYVDINQIRELVRVAQDSGVGEIVVEEEGTRIAIRMPNAMAPAAPAPIASAPVSTPVPAPVTNNSPSPEQSRPSNWICVKAPMVGTFYVAPAPGEAPFVSVGDEVTANQTLCIVEAMKLMNEIQAEVMGTIREVCLTDATPVEFGTPLFYIEPHTAG